MKVVSINSDNLPDAIALLAKGFPKRGEAFWSAALARISRLHADKGHGPIGTLLMKDDRPVGVLLTIVSDDPLATGRVVNLSSWYIEPQCRWFAPRMLQNAVSDPAAVYTDISPSRQAFALNEKLGFRLLTDRLALFVLPVAALAAPSPARVLPLSALSPDALAPQLAARMRDHAALGAVCAVLDAGGMLHPLIFAAARTRIAPLARLIYAPDRDLVLAHIGPIAAFLLTRGKLLLTIPVRGMEITAKGGFIKRKYAPVQIKGAWNDYFINLTYSETVLLRR